MRFEKPRIPAGRDQYVAVMEVVEKGVESYTEPRGLRVLFG